MTETGGFKLGHGRWAGRALVLLFLATVLITFYHYQSFVYFDRYQLRWLWEERTACNLTAKQTSVSAPAPAHGGRQYSTGGYKIHNKTIDISQIMMGNKNAFFIESSCSFLSPKPAPGGLRLNNRQACAIYSFAALNSDYQVYLFHTCPLHSNYYEMSSEGTKKMLGLNNVAIVDSGCGEGLANWLETGPMYGIAPKLTRSSYPVEHLSDALRLLLIWKYGGTYLDMDTLTIRKGWADLGENWAAAEDEDTIANGLMNASPEGPGHFLFGRAVQEFNDRFNGEAWSENGPLLITRIVRQMCNLSDQANFQKVGKIDGCGFTVLTKSVFYPIPYRNWQWYFHEDTEGTDNWRRDIEGSYAVHVWNKLSKEEPVTVGSRQPYGLLAAQYCAPVYYSSQSNF